MGRSGSFLIVFFVSIIFFSLPFIRGQVMDDPGEVDHTRAPGEQLYPAPSVTLSFSQDEYDLNPDPISGGDTRILGTVTCIIPDVVPPTILCQVTLSLFSNLAQNSDIEELYFNKDDPTMGFDMNIWVLTDLVGDTRIDLDVELRWEYYQTGQGSGYPDHYFTVIYIPPFGYIDMTNVMDYEEIEIEVGNWETVVFEIYNHRNMAVDLVLEARKIPPGLEVILEEESLHIVSYQTKLVKVRMRQSGGDGQESDLVMRLESEVPGEIPPRDFSFHVKTHSEPDPFRPGISEIMMGISFLIFIILITAFILILRKRRNNL